MIRGLYAITPDSLATDELLRRAALALEGGARVLQYRRKATPPQDRAPEAARLRALCGACGALFLVNDDPRLAAEVGADGVHLGRHDGAVAQARRLMGGRAIVGVSCYDEPARGEAALADGADYVAFGSFFPSRVKPGAVRPPLSLLGAARHRLGLPMVAIGGITLDTAPTLLQAGADAVAVISDLFEASDVRDRAAAYARLFSPPVPAEAP